MKNRYMGLPWTHDGAITRSMSGVIADCACNQPTHWVAACGFERDDSDEYRILNSLEWDSVKFGPDRYPFAKNLDQVLTYIWREMPMWVNSNLENRLDEEIVYSNYFASKELYFCQGPVCGQIISSEIGENVCVFCGFSNTLENCEPLGIPPNKDTMTQIYPDRFAPILKTVRDWFRDIPSLKKVGLEFGVVTYRFGRLLRRQLKFIPRPFFQNKPACYGRLNEGESNRCQMAPPRVRYCKTKSENWYEKEYRNVFIIKDPIFEEKNYLLGDPDMDTIASGSNGWI